MAQRFLIAFLISFFGVSLAKAQQESNSNRPEDYYEVTYYWAYREGGSGPDGTDPTKLSVPDPDEDKAKVALKSWQNANPNTLLVSGIGEKTIKVPVNRVGLNRNPPPTDPLKGPSARLTPNNSNQQPPDNPKSETEENYEKAVEESRKEIEETFNRLRRIPLIDEWDQIANEIARIEKKAIDEGNPIINESDPRIKTLRDRIVDFGRKRERDKKEAEDVLSLARKLALGRDSIALEYSGNGTSYTPPGDAATSFIGSWGEERWVLKPDGTMTFKENWAFTFRGSWKMVGNGAFNADLDRGDVYNGGRVTCSVRGKLVEDKLSIEYQISGLDGFGRPTSFGDSSSILDRDISK
jgi:hypothetical protein